jgi:phosphatidylglycerol:prolipoprotein diacylglycerol transferase
VGDFITWGALFGVMLGGRLGWVLFYLLPHEGLQAVLRDPLQIVQVWKGGMSSHGGILGLVLFTFWYARRHRLSWTSIGDSLCVVAPIGLCLVRCANFINGELYGKVAEPPGGPASVPWAVQFPQELIDNEELARRASEAVSNGFGAPVSTGGMEFGFNTTDALLKAAHSDKHVQQVLRSILPPRHPSQLYEALLEGVLLFGALWFLRTRVRVPRGVITGAFFILYGALRIVGEVFRVPDPAWAVGPLSAGQFLSLFLFLIGAAFLIFGFRTQQYERAVAGSEARGNVLKPA